MKLETAQLLIGIKRAGAWKKPCAIEQGHVVAAAADGVELKVLGRKQITRGEKTHIECIVDVTGLDAQIEQAEAMIASEKAKAAKALEPVDVKVAEPEPKPAAPTKSTAPAPAPANTAAP